MSVLEFNVQGFPPFRKQKLQKKVSFFIFFRDILSALSAIRAATLYNSSWRLAFSETSEIGRKLCGFGGCVIGTFSGGGHLKV